MLDGGEENPLLDSRFPDVSGKGRGYQIQALKSGLPEWPELRKISVWQTVGALEEVRYHVVYCAVVWCGVVWLAAGSYVY